MKFNRKFTIATAVKNLTDGSDPPRRTFDASEVRELFQTLYPTEISEYNFIVFLSEIYNFFKSKKFLKANFSTHFL